ncbi:hypothetical protein ACQPUQ_00410 [Clostridium paraputrificum]
MQMELELFNDMVNICKETEIQCKYRPIRFLQRLNSKGALVTTK